MDEQGVRLYDESGIKNRTSGKRKKQQKETRTICLKIEPEEAKALLEEWERKHYKAKARLLEALLLKGVLSYTEATGNLKLSGAGIKK